MIYLILVALAALAFIIITGVIKEAIKDGLWILLYRWFSGHTLNGHYYTDATWFRKASRVRHPTGRVMYWHHMPRIHRAGIRLASTVAIIAIAYGLMANRPATVLGLEIGGSVTVAGLVSFGCVKGKRAYRHRATLTPLSSALSTTLRLANAETERSVSLVPGYRKISQGKIGEIALPAHFQTGNEQAKTELEDLVSSRLPVDVDFEWKTRTRPLKVIILAAPKPPTMVRFESYIPEMEACEPGQVVVGLNKHRKIFRASFNLDDPHWGFSVGSGMGKTTFLLTTGAQILHNDAAATVDVIDPKQSGLDALIGIPGVRVACDPLNAAEMWELVESVYEEMMQRQAIRKRDKTVEFPIKVFMIDEVNTFADIMRDHWQDLKQAMKNAPTGAPPVWRKIARILWMGRETNIHIIVVGQKLDDKSVGGIGLRDSLGFRGLAGFKPNMWKILIGTTPIPRSQKPKGRWIYSDGQTETWVQNLYADSETIRAYASDRRTVTRTSRPDLQIIPADVPVNDYDAVSDLSPAFLSNPETIK